MYFSSFANEKFQTFTDSTFWNVMLVNVKNTFAAFFFFLMVNWRSYGFCLLGGHNSNFQVVRFGSGKLLFKNYF